MDILVAVISELPEIMGYMMLGAITGTMLFLPKFFGYAQDQRDHQTKLLGQILAELEELNRKNRV